MASDLVAFLRARLDDDERSARARWNRDRVTSQEYYGTPYDPTRVLADVDAKRQTVKRYAEVAEMDYEDSEPEYAYGRAVGLGEAVRLLALSYASHPGYREEWRPGSRGRQG